MISGFTSGKVLQIPSGCSNAPNLLSTNRSILNPNGTDFILLTYAFVCEDKAPFDDFGDIVIIDGIYTIGNIHVTCQEVGYNNSPQWVSVVFPVSENTTTLNLTITASSTNEADCKVNSYLYIDQITYSVSNTSLVPYDNLLGSFQQCGGNRTCHANCKVLSSDDCGCEDTNFGPWPNYQCVTAGYGCQQNGLIWQCLPFDPPPLVQSKSYCGGNFLCVEYCSGDPNCINACAPSAIWPGYSCAGLGICKIYENDPSTYLCQ